MSRTIPQVTKRTDLAGFRIQELDRLAMGLREKCPTCRYHNGGNCAIANAVLNARQIDGPVVVPPQLRHDESGVPICSSFRHKDEERLGIKNAEDATLPMF